MDPSVYDGLHVMEVVYKGGGWLILFKTSSYPLTLTSHLTLMKIAPSYIAVNTSLLILPPYPYISFNTYENCPFLYSC